MKIAEAFVRRIREDQFIVEDANGAPQKLLTLVRNIIFPKCRYGSIFCEHACCEGVTGGKHLGRFENKLLTPYYYLLDNGIHLELLSSR